MKNDPLGSQIDVCRPVGVIYAPYMAVSGDEGAVTNQQAVTLVIVFSEAVSGLTTSNFKASIPSNWLYKIFSAAARVRP